MPRKSRSAPAQFRVRHGDPRQTVRIGRRGPVGSFSIFDGRDIVIGDDTVIREQVFVGGPLLPDSRLEIGKRVRVFQTCFLNPTRPLTIGDDTGVGGRSSIFTHGSWQSAIDGYPVAFEPVTIGRNVWLPWHVFILPGVEIGDNATVGAGSRDQSVDPGGRFAAGVPAKVMKTADEWPRPIDEEQQWAIAQSIFTEMLDYLEDNGAHIERGESRATGPCRDRLSAAARRKIALMPHTSDANPGDQVVIAVGGQDVAGESAGPSWFSLREKRKGGPTDAVAEEIEDFLGRYGLRFAPVNEGG